MVLSWILVLALPKPPVVNVSGMPKLHSQFTLLFLIRVDAILESLADDHCPFCPTIYCLTISSDTDPTDAMNRERVHMESFPRFIGDGNLDFIPGQAGEAFQGYSLPIVWAV